ncbi:MAG: hypothetical protein QHI38_00530 [Armatimonadota bacterium]|nr:hypothetical protein [Armatimonadota bacterium]
MTRNGFCVLGAAVALLLTTAAAVVAGETKTDAGGVDVKTAVATENSTVSLDVKDSDVRQVFESLAKQSKAKIVLESTVRGSVSSISVNNVSLESALSAVCKSAKLQWRKILISENSKLLEQPDRFAATVRLMSGLGFPDLIIAASSTGRVQVHLEEEKSVRSVGSLSNSLGMKEVYLITNDQAVAAKAVAQEKADSAAKPAKFIQFSKDQMDLFMQMTPEEREQALISSLNMMDQIGPEYMAAVMESLANVDPTYVRALVSKQTQMMFRLSPEQRRAMMKFNMEVMKELTPEQMKILQEDALAVMQEMQSDAGK